MATRPREWPNNARAAREEAIAAAMTAMEELAPILSGMQVTPEDKMRRVAVASAKLAHIRFVLTTGNA